MKKTEYDGMLTYERAGLNSGHTGPRNRTVTFMLIYCELIMTAPSFLAIVVALSVHLTPTQ